jgi:hypothetical protein
MTTIAKLESDKVELNKRILELEQDKKILIQQHDMWKQRWLELKEAMYE